SLSRTLFATRRCILRLRRYTMKLPWPGLLLPLPLLIAACASGANSASDGQVPEISFDYPDSTFATPESSTVAHLKLLSSVARDIEDSTGALPTSMNAIVAFRRHSEYMSPTPEWGVDGWGRQIAIV